MKTRFDSLISFEFKCDLQYEFWPAVDESSRKLLLILHGRGDSGEGFHWLPEALDIDEFNYLFLDAPDTYGQGFSWYDVAPNQGPGVTRSRQLLTNLIEQLQQNCQLQSTDIYLLGFSQGSLMSLDLALRYPKTLGGVVGISGYVFFMSEYPAQLSRKVGHQRILLTHGTQDDVLPIEQTRKSIQKLQELGVPILWEEYEKPHSIDMGVEMDRIREFLEHCLNAN